MNRRGFLSGIFAAGVAPAFVRVGSLMRLDTSLIVPEKFTQAELIAAIETFSNRILTCEVITKEALQIITSQLPVMETIEKIKLKPHEARIQSGKPGDTLIVRRPLDYVRREAQS